MVNQLAPTPYNPIPEDIMYNSLLSKLDEVTLGKMALTTSKPTQIAGFCATCNKRYNYRLFEPCSTDPLSWVQDFLRKNQISYRVSQATFQTYKFTAPKVVGGADPQKVLQNFISSHKLRNLKFLLKRPYTLTFDEESERVVAFDNKISKKCFIAMDVTRTFELHSETINFQNITSVGYYDATTVFYRVDEDERFCYHFDEVKLKTQDSPQNRTKPDLDKILLFDREGSVSRHLKLSDRVNNPSLWFAYAEDNLIYSSHQLDGKNVWVLNLQNDPFEKCFPFIDGFITKHKGKLTIWNLRHRTEVRSIDNPSDEDPIISSNYIFVRTQNTISLFDRWGMNIPFTSPFNNCGVLVWEDKICIYDALLRTHLFDSADKNIHIFNPNTQQYDSILSIPNHILPIKEIRGYSDKICCLSQSDDLYVYDFSNSTKSKERKFQELPTIIHLFMLKTLMETKALQ